MQPRHFAEQIRHNARTSPGSLAVRAPGGERSFEELVARADAIAARLRGAGCTPGSRVVIVGDSSLAWVDVLIGASFARACVVPMSPSLTNDEQAQLLKDAHPSLIFADENALTRKNLPAECTVSLEELDDWLATGPTDRVGSAPQDADLFSIIYSSGTTGVPKGIAHTARSRADFVAARGRSGLGPGRLAYLTTAPHTNLSFLGIIGPLYHGAAVSLAPKFNAEGFLRAVESEGVTDVSLVPVLVRRVLDAPGFSPARLASLQVTMISGSPVDQDTKQRLLRDWPGKILDAYGTSETGGLATLDIKENPDRLDTVGKIMAGVEVRIIDEDGRALSVGEAGEIAGRTPLPMQGYFNREDLTDAAVWLDENGHTFFRTGDVGSIDEDNFLRVTGRAKDMIISGGLNIYAIDIETMLRRHPAIEEAAVIAIPDEKWGERPYAIVVLRDGIEASPDEISEWIGSRINRTSRPAGVEIVPELPRNALGKVLKRQLREPFWAGRKSQIA